MRRKGAPLLNGMVLPQGTWHMMMDKIYEGNETWQLVVDLELGPIYWRRRLALAIAVRITHRPSSAEFGS